MKIFGKVILDEDENKPIIIDEQFVKNIVNSFWKSESNDLIEPDKLPKHIENRIRYEMHIYTPTEDVNLSEVKEYALEYHKKLIEIVDNGMKKIYKDLK
jgi:hypothetical protein